MHQNLYLVPKYPKVPTVGGGYPLHTLPLGNRNGFPSHPCTVIIYILS